MNDRISTILADAISGKKEYKTALEELDELYFINPFQAEEAKFQIKCIWKGVNPGTEASSKVLHFFCQQAESNPNYELEDNIIVWRLVQAGNTAKQIADMIGGIKISLVHKMYRDVCRRMKHYVTNGGELDVQIPDVELIPAVKNKKKLF